MIALLAALLCAPTADAGFRAFQYNAKAASLRGCSECRGEPDDLCPVRPGAH